MKAAGIAAVTALMVLCFTAHVSAQTAKYDGNLWNKADRGTKELIIGAVFWGQEAAYDKVYVESILRGDEYNFQADCFSAVDSLLNALKAKKDSIDPALVIQNMDNFYSIPDNTSLRLKWAFLEAMLRVQGTPEEEIKVFVEGVRESHSN